MARNADRSDGVARFAVGVVQSTIGDRGRVTDQSHGHLPDFRIDYTDGRIAIGEVTAHVDPAVQSLTVEAARYGNQVALPAGTGAWRVWLSKEARVRRIATELPGLIADLALNRIFDLDIETTWPPGWLADRARHLKIRHVRQVSPEGKDFALYDLGPTGGWEPDDGNLIVDWLDALVLEPDYLDLTAKLQHVHADELHIFVLSQSRTEFATDSVLRRIDQHMPTRDPLLPDWVTHAWVVSQWASGRSAGLWVRDEGWSTVPIPMPPPN